MSFVEYSEGEPIPALRVTLKGGIKMVESMTMTIDEAAKVLGFSAAHIRRAIKNGELKAMESGRGFRISRPDLEAYYQSLGGGKLFNSEVEK